MNIESCFAKHPSVVSRKIADELILVPIRKKAGEVESIYTLNGVACRIWELIDGERRLAEIRDIVTQEFEVSEEEAEADMMEFMRQLETIGAVRTV